MATADTSAAAAAATPTQQLLQGLEAEWAAAVDHPFLRACMDVSIQPQQFDTWLTQDYLFVRGFVGFAAAALAACPDAHVDVLLAGVAELQRELAWFRAKAQERGLALHDTSMQPACQAYRALLLELKGAPYATQAAAFWAIELCYNQAWAKVLREGGAEQYKEFAHRWGNPEFGAYVQQLAQQADEALSQSPGQMEAARATVARLAALEVDFWGMAFAQCQQKEQGQQQQQQ